MCAALQISGVSICSIALFSPELHLKTSCCAHLFVELAHDRSLLLGGLLQWTCQQSTTWSARSQGLPHTAGIISLDIFMHASCGCKTACQMREPVPCHSPRLSHLLQAPLQRCRQQLLLSLHLHVDG